MATNISVAAVVAKAHDAKVLLAQACHCEACLDHAVSNTLPLTGSARAGYVMNSLAAA